MIHILATTVRMHNNPIVHCLVPQKIIYVQVVVGYLFATSGCLKLKRNEKIECCCSTFNKNPLITGFFPLTDILDLFVVL